MSPITVWPRANSQQKIAGKRIRRKPRNTRKKRRGWTLFFFVFFVCFVVRLSPRSQIMEVILGADNSGGLTPLGSPVIIFLRALTQPGSPPGADATRLASGRCRNPA